MHAGIGHVLTPKELAQRTSIAPKGYFVIFNAIESKCFQDAFFRVVAINIAFTDAFAQGVRWVDRTFVHVVSDCLPVIVMNEFC